MSPPTLLYFDAQGRAEAIRMLLHHAGARFTDKRISFPEFGPLKQNTAETPNGHLPVLIVDGGKRLVETAAIIRYVANEHKLHGGNNVEKAIIDSLLDTLKSLHDDFVQIAFGTPEEEKPAKIAKLDEKVKQEFKYVEFRAQENGGGNFLVGKKITLIDVYLVNLMDNLSGFFPNLLNEFPGVKKIDAATRESANLKKYLANRQ